MTESGHLHPCARCARTQKTCCQEAEILVTQGDLARIAAYTGRSDFWERRVATDPVYTQHDPADPEWRNGAVGPNGTRAVLVRKEGGDCSFLGAEGCVLPEETRPLVCRLYPFDYNYAGFTGEIPSFCPTEMLDPGRVGMVKVLGMDIQRAERWRRMLYAELGIPHEPTEPRQAGPQA